MNTKLGQHLVVECLKLVEEWWDRIAADRMALALTDEPRAEFDRRLADYKSDGVRGRLATEAVANIRRSL